MRVSTQYPVSITSNPLLCRIIAILFLICFQLICLNVLYVFPLGDAPTTDEAISNAKSVHEDISFIADISIDDETRWGIGYSLKCVVVRATAYR